MSDTNSVTQITHEELARLIRLLGMLGSEHDGEALNAARLAARWLRERGTDWATLLEPPETTGVVAVEVSDASEATEHRVEDAYAQGYNAGFLEASKTAEARIRAMQDTLARARAAQTGAGQGAAWTGLGGAYSGLGAAAGLRQPAAPQAPPGASGAAGGGAQGGASKAWPAGSWQAVAQELLDRHAAGIPGIFRGTREEAFVHDVLARGFRTLTQAQEVWLRDIAGRSGMSW